MNEKRKKIVSSFIITTLTCIFLTYTHFGRANELQRPRPRSRTHPIQKTFSCPSCDRTFTRRSNMKRHTLSCRTQSEHYQHQCRRCGKKFARRDGLMTHQATHDRQKPFLCIPCHSRYYDRSALSKHLRTKKHQRACELSSVAALATLSSSMQNGRQASSPNSLPPLPTLRENPQTVHNPHRLDIPSHLRTTPNQQDLIPAPVSMESAPNLWLVVSPVLLYAAPQDNQTESR